MLNVLSREIRDECVCRRRIGGRFVLPRRVASRMLTLGVPAACDENCPSGSTFLNSSFSVFSACALCAAGSYATAPRKMPGDTFLVQTLLSSPKNDDTCVKCRSGKYSSERGNAPLSPCAPSVYALPTWLYRDASGAYYATASAASQYFYSSVGAVITTSYTRVRIAAFYSSGALLGTSDRTFSPWTSKPVPFGGAFACLRTAQFSFSLVGTPFAVASIAEWKCGGWKAACSAIGCSNQACSGKVYAECGDLTFSGAVIVQNAAQYEEALTAICTLFPGDISSDLCAHTCGVRLCPSCPSGTFGAAVGMSACVGCANGTFSPAAGATTCDTSCVGTTRFVLVHLVHLMLQSDT